MSLIYKLAHIMTHDYDILITNLLWDPTKTSTLVVSVSQIIFEKVSG